MPSPWEMQERWAVHLPQMTALPWIGQRRPDFWVFDDIDRYADFVGPMLLPAFATIFVLRAADNRDPTYARTGPAAARHQRLYRLDLRLAVTFYERQRGVAVPQRRGWRGSCATRR